MKSKTQVTLWVFFVLALFASLYFHEAWGDEADAWLVARDNSLLGILKMTGTMGTPGLWYFLQFPFAHLGFPFEVQALLNLVVAAAYSYVLMFCSPFSLAVRVLLLFGYFLGFEYSVFARSYGLSVLVLFLLAHFYKRRFSRPFLYGMLLSLLANTNVHSFFLASAIWAVLVLEKIQRRKKSWTVVFISALRLGLAFLQLLPPPSTQLPGVVSHFLREMLPRAMINSLLPYLAEYRFKVFWVAALVYFLALIGFASRPKVLAFFLVSNLLLAYLFVFKYAGGVRHGGFLFLILVYSYWIYRWEKPLRYRERIGFGIQLARDWGFRVFVMTLFVSVAVSLRYWRADILKSFSGGKEMANYIRSHGLENSVIAAHPPFPAVSILPYFSKKRFFYPGHQSFGTHIRWDQSYLNAMAVPREEALRRIELLQKGESEKVYLVLSEPLVKPEQKGYHLIFETKPSVPMHHAEERFYLYEKE